VIANYGKEVGTYVQHRDFYNKQAQSVIEFCDAHDIKYHIKDGTITELMKVG
jgi:hypothetical protein